MTKSFSQTSIVINDDIANPLIHNSNQVVYQEDSKVIVAKNEKLGGYIQNTDAILPVVFDKIDMFQIENNLVRYNGEWGTYKDEMFNVINNPIFSKPDIRTTTASCNILPLGTRERSDCFKNTLRSDIESTYASKMDELHGILQLKIVVNDLGIIEEVTIEDATNLKIGENVKRMVFEKLNEWVPAKVDSKNVTSQLSISFNFNS